MASTSRHEITTPSRHDHTIHSDECIHQATLQKIEPDLEAMRQLITCKMCYQFLTEPYSLGCGHTYCYICLDTWLVAQKKRTCPDCRTEVKSVPVPSYIVRQMTSIFTTRAELLPDGATVAEHEDFAKEAAEKVAEDKAKGTEKSSGLFSGIFTKNFRARYAPLNDHHDHVQRCPACMWELEDGVCSGCGLDVAENGMDSVDEDDSDESEEEVDHDLLAEQEDVFSLDGNVDPDGFEGFDDAHPYDTDIFGMLPPMQRPVPSRVQRERDAERRLARRRVLGVYSSDDEDESSDEEEHDPQMDSFIDDEANDSGSENSGSDDEDDDEPEAQSTPPRRARYRAPIILDSDDEDASTGTQAAVVDLDPDSDDDDDDAPVITHRARAKTIARRAGRPVPRAIPVYSDDGSSSASDGDNDELEDGDASGGVYYNEDDDNDGVQRAGFSPLESTVPSFSPLQSEEPESYDHDEDSDASSATARNSERDHMDDDDDDDDDQAWMGSYWRL